MVMKKRSKGYQNVLNMLKNVIRISWNNLENNTMTKKLINVEN